MRALPLLLLALSLTGCADPFGDAKKADTIEAWQAYLDTSPTGSHKLNADNRLEELMINRANETKKVADYDAVLKRYPNTRQKKKLIESRAEAAYAAAEITNTADAWKAFLDENDGADAILKKKARKNVHVFEYVDKLSISEPVVTQVNLAEDPKGPKDGWGFSANITNNGDKTLAYLNIEVLLLDDAGTKLKAMTYPAVATTGPGGMPIAEAAQKPLAPGETRAWSYSTGEVPETWKQAVKLSVDDFRYDGAASLSGEDKPK